MPDLVFAFSALLFINIDRRVSNMLQHILNICRQAYSFSIKGKPVQRCSISSQMVVIVLPRFMFFCHDYYKITAKNQDGDF